MSKEHEIDGTTRLSGIRARLAGRLAPAMLATAFAWSIPLALATFAGQAQAAEPAKTRVETPAKKSAGAKSDAAASSGKKTTAGKGSDKPKQVAARKPSTSPAKTAVKPASGEPRRTTVKTVTAVAHVPPSRPSIGQAIGLHEVYDPLSLHSSVALAVDAVSGDVLFEKNAQAVLPIASISKLMTAMVVLDANLPLDERLSISEADIDTEKFTRSRLRPGTVLTRDEMLHLALMASENRAANALGRHYPGGLDAFVAQMNAKARELGMSSTHFVEPTGLSSSNVSSALDLAKMVRAASAYPLIREYSTAASLTVASGTRPVSFRNTNRLVSREDWDIGLQKTGYISEAGNCLVMQARVEGRPVVLVLLDASGKLSRFGDAQRLRNWIESTPPRSNGVPHAVAQVAQDS